MSDETLERALRSAADELSRRHQRFALVGGLAIAIRGEVRFTRDIDLAIAVDDDAQTEALIRDLASSGYMVMAIVEQEARQRLATVRLKSPAGFIVDLLSASSGVEREIVERATLVAMDGAGEIPVARAEELLALKVLSMSDQRPKDRADAISLLAVNPEMDLKEVRNLLDQITQRGFHRHQDLSAKFESLLSA
jgi:Nucleotidyl transferase AbiEii toxin, Type IV TA system